MIYQVMGADGEPLDAHVEVIGTDLVFHSRGGAKGTGTARNADYGPALRLLLSRIQQSRFPLEGVWLDSAPVRHLPLEQRPLLLSGQEAGLTAENMFRLISSRMTSAGQREGTRGGNSTKRILLRIGATDADFERQLGLQPTRVNLRSSRRLPADMLRQVKADHVWRAVEQLTISPDDHGFGASTDFDLLAEDGLRLPPKAVFGIAATEALGFEVRPEHFSGGLGTICFEALESAGYEIVPKGEPVATSPRIPTPNEDQEWSEGRPQLVLHLRRERGRGMAQAKREEFRRLNGGLWCERCGQDPAKVYGGEHGYACIEVHHRSTMVSEMQGGHRTRLEDLECLCANCHRVVHRLLRESSGA